MALLSYIPANAPDPAAAGRDSAAPTPTPADIPPSAGPAPPTPLTATPAQPLAVSQVTHPSDSNQIGNGKSESAQKISAPQPGVMPQIVAVPHVTYKGAKLPVKSVRYNERIKAWMDYDAGVRNWVTTALAAFATMPNLISYACPVPDQYREDMGADFITFEMWRPGEVRVMG